MYVLCYLAPRMPYRFVYEKKNLFVRMLCQWLSGSHWPTHTVAFSATQWIRLQVWIERCYQLLCRRIQCQTVTPYVIRMWYIYVGALHTCIDGSVVVTCFGSSRVPVFSCESRMPAYRSCTVPVTQWQVLRLPLHFIRFSMYKFTVPQEYHTVLCL